MGFFKRSQQVMRTGKQMADLKADHPEAWAAGEAAAMEALETRSDDLARMLIDGPAERVEDYRSRMIGHILTGIGSGEIEAPFVPVTQQALTAFAISMGVKIHELLDAERKEGRRKVTGVRLRGGWIDELREGVPLEPVRASHQEAWAFGESTADMLTQGALAPDLREDLKQEGRDEVLRFIDSLLDPMEAANMAWAGSEFGDNPENYRAYSLGFGSRMLQLLLGDGTGTALG